MIFQGLGFRVDVSGFRVRISKKKRFKIDGLGFRFRISKKI